MSETTVESLIPPPLLGEHTEDILIELLGYSSQKVAELRERACIK